MSENKNKKNYKKEIKFYSTRKEYGYFSNFHKSPFELENKKWPTSEHYFQAKKFEGTKWEEKIRKCKTPSQAAKMGRSRSLPLRKDWEKVKEDVMYNALKAKFGQNEDLKKYLLETKGYTLIEHTKNDSYWGDGGNGKGKNRLGILLMKLRKELLM
jgi:ribA/ribD-fused uncharacterized protein